MFSLLQRLRRKEYRKAKNEFVILGKDKSELEALNYYLKRVYREYLREEIEIASFPKKKRRYRRQIKDFAVSLLSVIDHIELLLSDETDYEDHTWVFLTDEAFNEKYALSNN